MRIVRRMSSIYSLMKGSPIRDAWCVLMMRSKSCSQEFLRMERCVHHEDSRRYDQIDETITSVQTVGGVTFLVRLISSHETPHEASWSLMSRLMTAYGDS